MALCLGYGNLIESATLSGGSWSAGNPLANLKTRYLAEKATSTTNTATIDIDLVSASSIGVVAVISANFTASATVRVQGSSASDQSVVLYDSTALAVYGGADYAISFAPVSARYWRITIADTAPPSIGRIFIGSRFRPTYPPDWSPSLAIDSFSVMARSIGGVKAFDRRPTGRSRQFKWSFLTNAEAYTWAEILRSHDITEEVFLIWDDSSSLYRDQQNFLGTLKQLSPIEYPYLDINIAPVEIEEIL